MPTQNLYDSIALAENIKIPRVFVDILAINRHFAQLSFLVNL